MGERLLDPPPVTTHPGAEPAASAPPSPEVGYLAGLNAAQRAAVVHACEDGAGARPGPPLLVIAGAGSGKTTTLAHRVAHLVLNGADPQRLLLLTFSRRAAALMTRRSERITEAAQRQLGARRGRASRIQWSGTFHAVANRLLRIHAPAIGLDPAFTVLDRPDSEDLMDLCRNDLGLARKTHRFPRKATCFAIYSHTVNAQHPLDETLSRAFKWCEAWSDDLRSLFRSYVDAKQRHNVLDYDDLLLCWHHLMSEASLAREIGDQFDHVLVDEYQDTNALQASILLKLKPDGKGITVVGDDAQSIYSFRAATVRNILDFPTQFDPPAAVITLEQNYRSTTPILRACNSVIAGAREHFKKTLFSHRSSQQLPVLAVVEDESSQAEYVAEHILEHREAGIALQRQAVLMRTSHHSDLLEIELGRRDIPFVKFGGLKFLEASHVKDVLCVLRWAENPRDSIAGFRVLQLLPGFGPARAKLALDHLEQHSFAFDRLAGFRPPASAGSDWRPLCALMSTLRARETEWVGQLGMTLRWYQPHLERIHDSAAIRAADLEQLDTLSAAYPSRERFLTELTLDPPDATGDEAGPPHLDEDYVILSTIHSAKGQEWDVVFVLNASDGCIPSDMSTGNPEQIEEERRLLYVAMTRARDQLYLVHPQRFYKRQQHRHGDAHVYAPLTRFLSDESLELFERDQRACPQSADGTPLRPVAARMDVPSKLRSMWE